MIFSSKVHFLLLLFTFPVFSKNQLSNSSSSNGKDYEKFFLNGVKATNLLFVSAKRNEPFMYQNGHGTFNNGIEYKLIKTMAEKENLELFFHNQAATFIKSHPIHDKIDIISGGLFPTVNFTSLDIYENSRPYYQDDLTWCVKKAGYFPIHLNIILGMKPFIWFFVLSTGFVIALMTYVLIQFDLNYKQRNQHDLYYIIIFIVMPAVIGFNSKFSPKLNSIRFFYVGALIMMFFLWQTIFYLGITFIKLPIQRHQVKTVAEVVENDYSLSGSIDVLRLISFDERYRRSQIDSSTVCSNIESCLDRLKLNENSYLAVGASRQRILNSPSYSPSKIFCFDRDEGIASYQPALLLRKDFPLKQRVDEIVRNAFESGLFIKWNRDSQRKKERLIRFEVKPELTLREYSILGFVFGFGWIGSFVAFVCELFIDRMKRVYDKTSIWRFLERFVDGKRYYLRNWPERILRKRMINERIEMMKITPNVVFRK